MPLELLPAVATTPVSHQILVATDFAEPSRRALSQALAIAAENRAYLSLAHALQRDPVALPEELELQRIDAERHLKLIVSHLGPGQKIDATVVKTGRVSTVIDSLIQEAGADLLIIGTRGRGDLGTLALGSVAEELLRTAPCPVMTIGPKVGPVPSTGHGFRRILFATGFGKASARALPLALSLARAHHAKLMMYHVLDLMPPVTAGLSAYAPALAAADEMSDWYTATRERARKRLQECLPPDAGLDQAPEFVVTSDLLPEGILAAARNFGADLIVMGAKRATGSARAAAHNPWAAVHEVVRDAPCPVLTVAG